MGKRSVRKRTAPDIRAQPGPREPAAPPGGGVRAVAWKRWGAALAVAVLLGYLPVFRGEFLWWDDQDYVVKNEAVRAAGGLARIWNPAARATPQFYPPVFTSYWLEHRIWGLDARGYHATNVVLHLANSGLLLLLVRGMGASPHTAVLCAAIFALHPTQVASAAWVSERKNTLAMLFYLLAFLAYLRHRRGGGWGAYAGCVGLAVLALLSKTQTATLPASLFFADWALQRTAALARRSLVAVAARMVPLVALGIAAVQITISFEARSWTPQFSVLDRFLLATNALWFYIRSFLVPVRLSPIYPLWEIAPGDWRWWVAPAALGAVGLALVRWRRRLPALALWGMAQFVLGVLPVLGVFSFNLLNYTSVADHLTYWSCIGGSLAVAIALDAAVAGAGVAGARRRVAWAVAAGLVLVAGTAATYVEASHWRTNERFWMRVNQRIPEGFLGNYGLGNHYRRTGEWARAVPYYRRATAIRPHIDFVFRRYSEALRNSEGPEAAIAACTERMAADPGFYAAPLERGISYEQLGRLREASRDLQLVLQMTARGSRPWAEAWRYLETVQAAAGT